jgi:predicted porin
MKKSLLALAVLGAFSGLAAAQSSVTLYGTIDVSGRYVKADGFDRRLSEATDGINSSQLGFRGVEDLGGGLRAGFTLLSSIGADAGNIGSGTGSNKFWNRRSTVSLFGPFGEVRLGRDYRPDFWNHTIFDAFGTNGLGSSTNVNQMWPGTRSDNSIGYFLPTNLGGLYGQVMAAAGEGGATLDRPGRYIGGRIGFAAGPFDIAVAGGEQKFGVPFNGVGSTGLTGTNLVAQQPGVNDKHKSFNIGGSFDFGFMKLLGYFDREEMRNYKEDIASISGVVALGQGEFHLGYDYSKLSGFGPQTDVHQVKGTYQYNLSKRTAVYTTFSRLDNKNNTRLTLPGAAGQATASGDSVGAEFGVRHFF